MVTFIFEAVKPALGGGVVPAVAFSAHGAGHAKFFELVLKRLAGVLPRFN
jgi:hypothetical protein